MAFPYGSHHLVGALVFFLLLPSTSSTNVTLAFETASLAVRDTYLSFNVDSGSLYQLFDFTDPVFTQLVKNLATAAPTQVRIGGGAADNLFFTGVGGARGNCSLPSVDSTIDICVDAAYFAEICAFGQAAGVGLVWDLNVALRRNDPPSSGSWNSSNAEALFNWLVVSNPSCPIAAWQLGNEVEDFYKRNPVLNISGQELAADYLILRSLLSEPRFSGLQQKVNGPDACCEERLPPPIGTWLHEFSAGTVGSLQAVTVHDYPIPRLANNSCEPDDFFNKNIFATLRVSIAQYAEWAAPQLLAGVPLIVGETATSAHGGCNGLSNTFSSGFTFMYELGAVAEMGAVQMNRQDLAGFSSETEPSNYGLLGPPGWSHGPIGNPHPDYFIALLFKQLAGSLILRSNYTSSDSDGSDWDSHIWCGVDGVSLVITYFNMGGGEISATVPQLPSLVPRTEFLLTSSPQSGPSADPSSPIPPPSVTTDTVFLLGQRMVTNPDGGLPVYPISGRTVTDPSSTALFLPPWSYGFVLLHGMGGHAAGCTQAA